MKNGKIKMEIEWNIYPDVCPEKEGIYLCALNNIRPTVLVMKYKEGHWYFLDGKYCYYNTVKYWVAIENIIPD